MRKRALSIVCTAAVVLASCANTGSSADAGRNETSASASSAADSTQNEKTSAPASPAKLENKMTEFERSCAEKRPFILGESSELPVEVGLFRICTSKEEKIANYDKMLEKHMIDKEYYDECAAEAEDSEFEAALINGVVYDFFVPEKDYDGGKLELGEDTFESDDEYFAYLSDTYCPEILGMTPYDTKVFVEKTKALFDAVENNNYTELPDMHGVYSPVLYDTDPLYDHRSDWTYEQEKLDSIKDRIEEYSIYDQQMGVQFTVDVTLPPEYDKDKTYPVFFLTDGVWRLNDLADLYKIMEQGEAENVLLVSLSYDYSINNTDDHIRSQLFIDNRDMLLDFVTDDLMPYLCENYSIDCVNSTLFGHSMGGVFSHYALCNSDKYENQPFGKYIIGSPALFNLYNDNAEYDFHDAAGAETDYGYFDRHDALEKQVFLCGGSEEDPDYADKYSGHDSLLEGLAKMNDRFASHGGDITYKLYESHHYQYIPEMLAEYLKTTYPKK